MVFLCVFFVFLLFLLVFLGFPGRFKALVSYKPVLMAVAWLYYAQMLIVVEIF